jgi:hypothetical protein
VVHASPVLVRELIDGVIVIVGVTNADIADGVVLWLGGVAIVKSSPPLEQLLLLRVLKVLLRLTQNIVYCLF